MSVCCTAGPIAMDGRIMCHGVISSCHSAATSGIVKRFWSRVWLSHVSSAIPSIHPKNGLIIYVSIRPSVRGGDRHTQAAHVMLLLPLRRHRRGRRSSCGRTPVTRHQKGLSVGAWQIKQMLYVLPACLYPFITIFPNHRCSSFIRLHNCANFASM